MLTLLSVLARGQLLQFQFEEQRQYEDHQFNPYRSLFPPPALTEELQLQETPHHRIA